MNTPALNEVLREYIDDGGSPEVADQANKELDALIKQIREYKEVLGTLDQIGKMSLGELYKRLRRLEGKK